MTVQPRPRLGDLLVGARVITPAQLERALREQSSFGGRLGQALLALGYIDETKLASAVAAHLGLPAVDLDRARLAPGVVRLLPLALAERYGLMPLGAKPLEGRLLLACLDPTNLEAQAAAREATGQHLVLHVATASAIERAIRRYYYGDAAAPAPTPCDAQFTVTRHTIDPVQAGTVEHDVVDRVAALEQRVERLNRLVETLLDVRARERQAGAGARAS
jgi:type IV pilus assembly protein PilB